MLPITLLSVFGIAGLFLGFKLSKPTMSLLTVLFIAISALVFFVPYDFPAELMGNMMVFDKFGVAFSLISLFIALLIIPMLGNFNEKEFAQPAEYYSIILFSLVGVVMMSTFNHVLALFLGVEILSISMYVLTGSDKKNIRSIEASLKYLLMGSFATGFLLFGIALLYAATGGFTLAGYTAYIANNINQVSPIFYLGLLLLMIGLLFKVSVAPFHFWAPDVYDGAPIPFTAFMSTVVKMAGFAALYKVISVSMVGLFDFWWTTLAICALFSLLIGNLVAANQTSFKRLLAYSGISHAGYLLISVTTAREGSDYDLLFYSFSYALASVLAFYVLDAVAKATGSEDLDALKGFAKSNKFLGFVLTVSMLSLAGLPLTGGFIGKFLIFSSAIEVQRMAWLVFAGIMLSVVGAYYYIKPVAAAYFKEGYTGGEVEISSGKRFAIAAAVMLTVVLGILPVVFSLFYDAI